MPKTLPTLRSFSIALLFLCLLCSVSTTTLHAQKQKPTHWLYAQENASFNKQLHSFGYAIGIRRTSFYVSAGFVRGFDKQFLSADQRDDDKAKQKISDSPTIFISPKPANSYLERCNSNYTGNQYRLGFSTFLRRNDTLDRVDFSGPFAGIEAVYIQQTETQEITYKANDTEDRYYYSGSHTFISWGAASHIGWQFVLAKQRLYIKPAIVVPFYYPLISEYNINSPFTGIKYEGMVRISWRLNKAGEQTSGEGKAKVREKI
ncbi:MAG: hypothetical protein ACRCYO_10450 [Bacteroidia bacterium]